MRIGPASIGSAALMAALLSLAAAASAQTAADHGALAHGKPIVDGRRVQPTPDVVQERWRHHELMLRSKRREAAPPDVAAPMPDTSR